MKVAYCADFSQHWHTETHVARSFELLGHDVHRVDGPPDRDVDLVLLQGNGGPHAPAWLDHAKARGIRSCSYHLDLFVGLARQARVGNEPLWWADTVFTADGDPNSQAFFEARGINHRWLPAAVVADETEPGRWRAEYDYDVVFVGARQYHSEHRWRGTLIDFLENRYGDRFRLFQHHPPTRGRDLNDLYATARVVVGDSLVLPGHRNYVSDRLFETIGRGGFLIFPFVPGLEDFVTNGVHLAQYDIGDTEQVADLIELALDRPDMARKIADEGHAHVIAHHTYDKRVQRLLDEVFA